jgi:transposase
VGRRLITSTPAALDDNDRRNRAIVARLAAGVSLCDVADEFGLTTGYIRVIRRRITGTPWPKQERIFFERRNRMIVKRLLAGATLRAVGSVFGLSSERIRKIGAVAGVRSRRDRRMTWPIKRIAGLRKLWGTMSTAAIGCRLGVSGSAVRGKAIRLGLSASRVWPHDRIAMLQALRRKGLTLTEIACRLGVSKGAVAAKVRRLDEAGAGRRIPRVVGA